jgi:hypothetical protein
MANPLGISVNSLRPTEAAYRITASFEVGFRLAVEGMEWIQTQRRRTDEKTEREK